MVFGIKVKNKNNTPLGYMRDAPNDVINRINDITFSPGVNIIVGNNGTYKSSIINLIKAYVHIETWCSEPEMTTKLSSLNVYDYNKNIINDGADVICDWDKVTFNLLNVDKWRIGNKFDFSGVDEVRTIIETRDLSSGQVQQYALDKLFNIMFSGDTHEYRQKIQCKGDYSRKLLKYYKRNHKPSNTYTLLMDEPDINLDVDGLLAIYKILSYKRDDTQIICVLHNPMLIYLLHKKHFNDINFIEMTNDYLNKISIFIES